MSWLDETHGPERRSWVSGAQAGSDFPAQNLPLGIFSEAKGQRRPGVAIGVVACPDHGEDVGALLDAADAAMYLAKAGGDAVAVGTPLEPEITVERTT